MRVGSGFLTRVLPKFGSSTDAIFWTTTEIYSVGLPTEHSYKGKMTSLNTAEGIRNYQKNLTERCITNEEK
jgi:hypothetical protein